MKALLTRRKLVSATLLSIVAIAFLATRPARSLGGIAFIDAKEVIAELTDSDLAVQDSLVANITTYIQFNQMDADDQQALIAVANATWYKNDAVLGFSIDRRGRGGLGADAASPILLELVDGQLVFNCVNLTPQPRSDKT